MERLESAKKWFIHTALSYLGTPYRWGGDDPSGFDCSGFALECLKSVGLVGARSDYSADGLKGLFRSGEIDEPFTGALLFTLDSARRATHVSICLDKWFQIGASGGSSKVLKLEDAWIENAYVRVRPIQFNLNRFSICDPFLKINK